MGTAFGNLDSALRATVELANINPYDSPAREKHKKPKKRQRPLVSTDNKSVLTRSIKSAGDSWAVNKGPPKMSPFLRREEKNRSVHYLCWIWACRPFQNALPLPGGDQL